MQILLRVELYINIWQNRDVCRTFIWYSKNSRVCLCSQNNMLISCELGQIYQETSFKSGANSLFIQEANNILTSFFLFVDENVNLAKSNHNLASSVTILTGLSPNFPNLTAISSVSNFETTTSGLPVSSTQFAQSK